LKIPHLPLASANRDTSSLRRGESWDPAFYRNRRRTSGGGGGRGGGKGEGEQGWGVGINHTSTPSGRDSAGALRAHVAEPGARRGRAVGAAPPSPLHLSPRSRALRGDPRPTAEPRGIRAWDEPTDEGLSPARRGGSSLRQPGARTAVQAGFWAESLAAGAGTGSAAS